VGLAITDTPASLGTEPLKFAVRSRGNLFSSACETVLDLDAALDGPALAEATKSGFLAAFTALFKADKDKADKDAAPPHRLRPRLPTTTPSTSRALPRCWASRSPPP
jgi:hypothetical protein